MQATELAAKHYLQSGSAHLDQRDFDGAVQAFKAGLELAPHSAEIYHNLGIAYRTRDRFREAVGAFTQAIDLQAEYPEAHYGLADALFKSGSIQESICHFQTAISLCPPDAEDALLTLHYNLGAALYKAEEKSEAVEHWRKALQIDPGFLRSHAAIADALISCGDMRGAAFHVDILARLNPDSAPAREEAIALYKEVLEQERRSPRLISIAAAQSEIDSLLVQAANRETDFGLLLLKLECCHVRCEESRRVARSGSAKAGAVIGGTVGLLGGPLGVAAGAFIGAKFFGGSNDRRDVWSPVFDSISLLKARLLLG